MPVDHTEKGAQQVILDRRAQIRTSLPHEHYAGSRWTGKHRRSAQSVGQSWRSKIMRRITTRNRMRIEPYASSYSYSSSSSYSSLVPQAGFATSKYLGFSPLEIEAIARISPIMTTSGILASIALGLVSFRRAAGLDRLLGLGRVCLGSCRWLVPAFAGSLGVRLRGQDEIESRSELRLRSKS